jgi:prophage DNA circulation protein
VHEYPGRDEPFVEDMGLKAREFALTAYVIGTDYQADRDALIDACAKGGAGTLVHPYYGTLNVMCTGCTVSESTGEGGMAVFSLKFMDAGQNALPSGNEDTRAGVVDAADSLTDTSRISFTEEYDPSALPGWATNSLRDVAVAVVTAAGKPVAFGAGDDMGLSSAVADVLVDAVSDLSESQSLAFVQTCSGDNGLQETTPVRSRVSRLADGMRDLARRSALAVAATRLAETDYVSRNQAIAAFNALNAYLETEQQVASNQGNDDVFFATQDLRTAVVRDIAARAAILPGLRETVNNRTEPALVSAYRLSGSAMRADDLVARNAVRHPGFVPGGSSLEVLDA